MFAPRKEQQIFLLLSQWILRLLFYPQQRAENALKFYRGFRKDVGEMNNKLKLEYDNMTCMIKMANCDASRGKITIGDFCKIAP